ncbi:MAG: hypothetical protein J6K46_02365 [Sutterella sp.]|nr:hypothetical protein [Sutterella sp.]
MAEAKKNYVHSLRVYLVGGQTFTLNEVTNSTDIPVNVVAFINAWREKKDVWHSPANDPHFGVRVLDVSLYEYRVAELKPKAAAPAPRVAEGAEKAEAKRASKLVK